MCPTAMAKLGEVMQLLGADADLVQPVYALDRRGLLRLFIRPESGAESVARDLRALLEEPAG